MLRCVRPFSGIFSFLFVILLVIGCGGGGGGSASVDDTGGNTPVTMTTYYVDTDGDGYGDASDSGTEYESDPGSGYSLTNDDCDDTDPGTYPSATETADDGIDQNCNGHDLTSYYADTDSDGYGDSTNSTRVDDGTVPVGYVTDSSDCDDTDPGTYPGATETADDGIDQNCNGHDLTTYYADTDGDGYGDFFSLILFDGAVPAGYVTDSSDCDDTDPGTYPGATETADDGIDQNCNGHDLTSYYADTDSDGYGDVSSTILIDGTVPNGYSENPDDCDDTDELINPAATETADDGIDQNCNGYDLTTYYADTDGDGYGDVSSTILIDGVVPNGYSENPDDCNDNDELINPGVMEICGDGIDNDCDLQNDEFCVIQVPTEFTTIQEAIDAASSGAVITVDDGTYVENIDFKGKAITVQSLNGSVNTIIDGNASGTVVTFTSGETSASTLDGFSISNGSAYYGGGIYCGLYSSPTILNCLITDNSATSSGAGIFCGSYSSPTILNCFIIDNSASSAGAGIYCGTSSAAEITGCTIVGNSAYSSGGGIFGYYSTAIVTNCTITGNNSSNGGGISCNSSSSLMIVNCTIKNNTAYSGGGIICRYSAVPSIINCIIADNAASYGGGIFSSDSSSPTVTNCTFANNHAYFNGGGIYISSTADFLNCIVWGNTANSSGDAVYLYSTNSPAGIDYSDIDTGAIEGDGTWTGANNINSDPLFASASDYHIRTGSPCIDAGTSAGAPLDDIDGNTRPQGISLDIGADETSGTDSDSDGFCDDIDCDDSDSGIYPGALDTCGDGIDTDCSGTDTACISVPSDYATIQEAINASSDGDVITVSDGTYYENVSFKAKDVIVQSLSGAATTIIDGGSSGSVVTFNHGETSAATLDGFTLRNGSAIFGGGINCDFSSSPTIKNCTVTANSASSYGGGIYCYSYTAPVITGCTISGNSASSSGGGVYCYLSSPAIENCTITANSAPSGGGISSKYYSLPTITSCTISDNSAPNGTGGGIYCYMSSSPEITGCTVTTNSASSGSGIYCSSYAAPTLTDCTISNNPAINGGGIYCVSNASPTLINSTISGNSASTSGGGIYSSGSSPTIEGGTISGNSASTSGGGVYFKSSSSVTITGSTISGNSASKGGGVYCLGSSSSTITGSAITSNTATTYGGGIYCDTSSPMIEASTINANSANYGGGAYCLESSPTVTNCTITDNTALYGAGIRFDYDSDSIITNSIFANNESISTGGGLEIRSSLLTPLVVNTIFWQNTAVTGNSVCVGDYGSSIDITYSDINPDDIEGPGSWTVGPNSINADPLFLDDSNADPLLRDYHLTVGSPCIDIGDDGVISGAAIPTDDIDSDTRPMGTGIDIGSDETSGTDNDGDGIFSDHDCDDYNAAIYPGATEICNGVDDNCDGVIDEGC